LHSLIGFKEQLINHSLLDFEAKTRNHHGNFRPKSPNSRCRFCGPNRKIGATDFEVKPGETVTTGFETKPKKTITTGFKVKSEKPFE
jgi:hypothetical protein